jgi:hypothetical protein
MTRRTRRRRRQFGSVAVTAGDPSAGAVKRFPLPPLLERLIGPSQPLLEIDRRLVSEDLARLGDVSERMAHVPRPRVDVDGLDLAAGKRREPGDDLVEAGPLAASRLASTALSTKVKSRDCSPSPWTTGRPPSSAAVMKFGITAAYCDWGSWPGPKTLK